MLKDKKIGLALGGGAARGWAHLGVIRALEEKGIKPDYVAGTSIGALVGGAYASGKIEELHHFSGSLDWKQLLNFFDPVFPRTALVDGKKVERFLRELVDDKKIEDLEIPFSAVATDLYDGGETVIASGDAAEAIRASISIPGIFTPVKKGRSILTDGGLVNPVPINVVREMGADFVIAVDLNHDSEGRSGLERIKITGEAGANASSGDSGPADRGPADKDAPVLKGAPALKDVALEQVRKWFVKDPEMPNIFEVLMASINIMESRITESNLIKSPADLLIRPNLGDVNFLEFHRAAEVIEEGLRAARALLKAYP